MNALIHKDICERMNALYIKKNTDYGDSFAKVRNRIPFYTLSKLADKYERLEHLMLSGADANYESIEDTLFDIANYAVMELTERQVDRAEIAAAMADSIPDIEIDIPKLDASFVDVTND